MSTRIPAQSSPIEREFPNQRARDVLNLAEAIIRASPVGIAVFKASGPCFSVNEAVARLLGGTVGEILKQNFRELESWKSSGLLEAADEVLATHSERRLETRFVTTFGKGVWLAFRLVPVDYDGEAHLLAIVADIAERKRSEQRLADALNFNETVLRAAPVGILVYKATGQCISANAAAAGIIGCTKEQALAQNFRQLESWKRHGLLATAEAALETQEERHLEGLLKSSYGKESWINCRFVPFGYGDEKHLLLAITDITRSKQREQQLSRLNDCLVGLGVDPDENINRLVALCGELSQATCALFNQLENEFLCSLGQWHAPPDFPVRDLADGHICTDVVRQNTGAPLVIRNLQQTAYARTDSNVRRYGLKTYVGVVVRCKGKAVGSLCLVYQDDVEPDAEILKLVSIIATAVGSEQERKQAEKGLRASQALYHSFVEQLPAAAFRKDREGRYVMVNPRFCQLKGVAAAEFLGRTAMEVAAFQVAGQGEEGQATKYATIGDKAHEEIMRTGKSVEMEEEYPATDGGKMFMQSVRMPVYDADGTIVGTQGILLDVTTRKRTELALRESHEFNETLLQTIPFGIDIVDEQGRILFLNAAMKKIAGESALGARCWEIYRDDRQQCGSCPLRQPIVVGETKSVESTGVFGGRIFEISHTGMLYEGRKAVLEVFNDVTERRKLEEQFRQAQKMEAIGRLAGGVAHDFNNMLAVVQIHADMMRSDPGLPLEHRQSAEEITAATDRATALTRQLLLFGRKEILQPRDLELNECVNNITKMLRRILGEDVQLQFKFAMESLFIHADPGMMDQVLMNLAVNSRDAMPKGGRLVIETSAAEVDEQAASQSPHARPGSFVCLSVCDNGTGIAPENLPRIFEPFFTTKDVGKGTGLGLATVLGIVQQHQGWITVHSLPGNGTTFRIYLPRLKKIAAPAPAGGAAPSAHGGTETILLVEDENSVRLLVKKALTRLGYSVLEARDGVEALECWRKNKNEIRLLLTDLVMPEGISGKNLADRLLQENPQLKILYTSGYRPEEAHNGLALEEGVNFLAKPFMPQKLSQVVRCLLDA